LKIVIFGAGSIGCYVGGKLSKTSEVTLYGRHRLKNIIVQHGLRLSHYEYPELRIHSSDIEYSTNLSCLKDADLVMLTVKSHDTENALKEMKPFLNPEACIVSLQNGVKNPALLMQHLPEWETAGGMVPYNIVNLGKGHFHCGTEGELIFERKKETKLLSEKCISAGLPTELTNNIQGVLWGKILLNLNNGLNALSDKSLKEQLSNKNYRNVLANSIDEAINVIESSGIEIIKVGKTPPKYISRILRLPNFVYQAISNAILKIDPKARSSMSQDLQAGRPTEIDYINGAVVELATKHNIGTPVNSRIMALVKQAFLEGKSPGLSGSDLIKLI